MQTSKSPLTVARMALSAASEVLADYARPTSPKKFTQPQLFACLIVKEFTRNDYRGMMVLLSEWSDLRGVLGLTRVPHFTTLCQAEKRLLRKPIAETLLAAILGQCRDAKLLAPKTKLAAIDSTGLETRHISSYFTKRRGVPSTYKRRRYPKLSAVCDTANHLILGIVINRGPKPDSIEARPALAAALRHQPLRTLLADAGYESEGYHEHCRKELGVRSIIPSCERGRSRKDGKPRPIHGKYRGWMARRFPKKVYGQRWQIETVFSMIKRNLGSALRARTYHSQGREIRARVLTHNLAILNSNHVLYRAAWGHD
jgi:hypothetical protein